jgi:hypothetical protein
LKKWYGFVLLVVLLISCQRVLVLAEEEYIVKPVEVNADPRLALDIVLVSANFSSREEFEKKVIEFRDFFFSIEPFSEFRSRINIWMFFNRIDFKFERGTLYNFSQEIHLKEPSWSILRGILERNLEFEMEIDGEPPEDQIAIYLNGAYGGIAGWNAYYSIGTSSWILVHELGHSFGGLLDEYPPFGEPDPEHPCIMAGTSANTFCPRCQENLKNRLKEYLPKRITIFAPSGVRVGIKNNHHREFWEVKVIEIHVIGKNITVSFPSVYPTSLAGERYLFSSWEDGRKEPERTFEIEKNLTLRTNWIKEYWLEIISPYPVEGKSSWYREGEKVTIYAPEISKGLTKMKLEKWEGDASGDDNPLIIVMDSPKRIIVKWKEDLTGIYALIAVILAITVFAIALSLRPKRPLFY